MSRERAGNILATGSRLAQLVQLPCRDQCQGQSWDFTPRTMPAWERSKKDSTIGVERSGTSECCKQWSLTADPTGLSPMPPRAPPQKLLPAPNMVPTGKVGKRQHQTQKTLGLRHGKEPPKVGGGHVGGLPVGGASGHSTQCGCSSTAVVPPRGTHMRLSVPGADPDLVMNEAGESRL